MANLRGDKVTADAAARGLFAAIVRLAVTDAQAGRPCDGKCSPQAGAHACAADALDFLAGPWCAAILAWLDLDPLAPALLEIIQHSMWVLMVA